MDSTPSYTKWFNGFSQPGTPAPVASTVTPGQILAYGSENRNAQPPTNGEIFRMPETVDIPWIGTADNPQPLLAKLEASFTVEDWGYVSLDDEPFIDLMPGVEAPTGPLGGHTEWTRSGSRDIQSGEHKLLFVYENIAMPDPMQNRIVCEYQYKAVALERGGKKVPDCGSCSCSAGSDAGGIPTSIRSAAGDSLASSSSGCNVAQAVTEDSMLWSCNTGVLRGMGAVLDGKLQLYTETFGPALASPAALSYKHPMLAVLELPEGGALPGAKLQIRMGDRVIALRYYLDGMVAPIGVDTAGNGKAVPTVGEGGIITALKWQDDSGAAWLFDGATGSLISYTSPDMVTVTDVSDCLVVKKSLDDTYIRQIWSLWDGLVDITDVSPDGYKIRLYTPAQVGGLDADGFYTVADGAVAFKSFEVAYAATGLAIVEKVPGRDDFSCTWSKGADGAWSLAKGADAAEAVVTSQVRTVLESAASTGFEVWQLVKTVSKGGVAASCVCEVYQDSPMGNLLLTRVEGFGSDSELVTRYEYDGSGNVVSETSPTGHTVTYCYDPYGRMTNKTEPWGAGDYTSITNYTYAYSSAQRYSSQIATETRWLRKNGAAIMQMVNRKTYSYSVSNGVYREEIRTTAVGSSYTKLSVTETWTEDAPSPLDRGRVRMTQSENGVQTWHEYAATTLHGALYTETTETRVNGVAVPGQSTRTVNFIDCEGNTVRTEQFVMLDDGTWALIAGSTNMFDVQNRLTGTVHDNGRSTSQALNCQGDLLWQIDEDGVRTDYAYDSARQLIETTRSATQTTPEIITEYERDAEGNTLTTTTHTGAMDTVSRTAYDLAGRVVSETDILGRVTTTAYSADNLTTTVTLPSGATLITTTNPDGSVAREYGTGQRETLHVYDFINGLRETVKLPDGTILSQNITDGFGQTITQTAPTTLPNTYIYTRSVYNALGQMTRQTVGNMAPTVFEYGAMGQMTKQTVLLDATAPTDATKNQITEFAYGYETIDGGVYQTTTTTGHNAEGGELITVQKSLVSQLSAVLESKSISIDVRGNVTTQWTEYGVPTVRMSYATIPTSDVTATATIIDGFTTTSTDNTGVTNTFTRAWTESGMVQTFTDGRGNTTTTHTDIAGRTVSVTDAAGFTTSTEYCAFNDQPAVVTNALGKTSCYRYDIRSRKVAEFGTAMQPALFAYDDANNLTALTTFRVDDATLSTDPASRTDGDTTQWTYNAATGLEMSKTYPDNTQVLKTYDAMNRLATVTNARGIVQTRAYATATGLLTGITFSDTTTPQGFQYNVLGQLTQVTDAAGTRTFTYNQYAQPLTDSVTVGTSAYPVAEAYDTFGRSTGYELKKADSAFQTVGYGYDTKGRLSTCYFLHGGEQKTFTYNRMTGTHLLERLDSPNGMSRNYTYEPHRDLIATLNDKRGATAVVNRSYTYNALGIPTNRTIQRQGTTRNDTFTHNDRSELTAATMGSNNYAYDYDNIGNRKTAQETANEFSYEANALNQYTQITENNTDFVPTYDLDGNQTRIKTTTGIWTATYNALNRPVRFENAAAGIVITADYDYMGRRVFKKVETNNAVTSHLRFLYRGYLQIAALDLTRSTQNAMWLITWDPTESIATRPLAIQQSGTWYTYGLDLPKNVTELYAQNGYIATAYTYSPYGLVTSTGSVTQHIQWSSEYADTDLGLVYYNYRHYNPMDGRWCGRDFVRSNRQLSLFAYVANCPLSRADRLGLAYVPTLQKTALPIEKAFAISYFYAPLFAGNVYAEFSFGFSFTYDSIANQIDYNVSVVSSEQQTEWFSDDRTTYSSAAKARMKGSIFCHCDKVAHKKDVEKRRDQDGSNFAEVDVAVNMLDGRPAATIEVSVTARYENNSEPDISPSAGGSFRGGSIGLKVDRKGEKYVASATYSATLYVICEEK